MATDTQPDDRPRTEALTPEEQLRWFIKQHAYGDNRAGWLNVLDRALREAEAAAGPRDESWDQRTAFAMAERALAVPHREDDQPCGCDECMAYGAEDEGADWYRFPTPRRIVIRALDSGDDRLAPLAQAVRDHEAAAGTAASTTPGPRDEGLREALDRAFDRARHEHMGGPSFDSIDAAIGAALNTAQEYVRAALAATPAPEADRE